MEIDAAHAMIRFGLGIRPGEPPPRDPKAWLRHQLQQPDPVRFPDTLPSTADGLILLREQRRLKPPPGESLIEPLFRADAQAQLAVLLDAQAPFRERLVWFWANHFTVSTRQNGTRPIAGAFVREAIRPHVTGSFQAMLLAVMRHPAMLMYLDNTASVGPHSRAGHDGTRGLNENLARECLELHTISPAAGYDQADVSAFAAILTGWSVDDRAAEPGFVFHDRAHEPGDKTLMGRSFPEGEAGGVLALDFLGSHPATCRHLAQKLAVHFLSDTPSPEDVAALSQVLQHTRGDLGAVSLALLDRPAAWQPATKFRTPFDFVVATLRALDLPAEPSPDAAGSVRERRLPGMLAALGQPVWTAPLPNGWPDRAVDWAAPEAMLARIDWSYRISGHASTVEPMDVAVASLGPLLRPGTQAQIRGAGDRRDALTLLFSSPEFQRR